jgi:RNA polymerase sigma factor (sigma-70 family)
VTAAFILNLKSPLFFRKQKISKYTDQELLMNYRSDGKTLWLGELYNRYSHLVFGLCLKYLKNEDNAKDAVLAVFEKLVVDLKKREVATFQHWLYAVSRNHCLETLRIQGRDEKRKMVFHHENAQTVIEDYDVLSFAEMKEVGLNKLEAAMKGLSEDQRNCIDLFYLKEKSYREITEATGYALKDVKTHLQNGRRNLKIQLLKQQ